MLDIYADFAINDAAIPVIKGEKSRLERFAGALRTYTIEAMMRDKKALQSGTSHNLGQNFAKAFDIKHLTESNAREFCWTTSWGLSTRMVGAVVMAHGDDKGLRLPPKLAPYQAVMVPIYKNDGQKTAVMETVAKLHQQLRDAGLRVYIDRREGLSPGFKFNDWEMRGVSVRLEIGPKDVEKNNAALARRDIPGRAGKRFVSQDGIAETVAALLDVIQANLLKDARTFRDENMDDVSSYDELKQVIEAGRWARAWWRGSDEDELAVKDETGATIRCYPFEQPDDRGECVITGKTAEKVALFAKAY